jgi:hypothetical protein
MHMGVLVRAVTIMYIELVIVKDMGLRIDI